MSVSTLKNMHLFAGIAHLVQSGYTFILTNTIYKDKGYYSITNQVDLPMTGFKKSTIGSFRLGNMIGIFPFLSCINHFWAYFSTRGYSNVLIQQINPVRWLEYSASAGIMFNVISILSGQNDVNAIINQLIGNIGLQFVGYLIESNLSNNNQKQSIMLEVLGFIIFISIWIPIMNSFFSSLYLNDEKDPEEEPEPEPEPENLEESPNSIIWIIIIIMTILMLSFGILSVLQAKKVKFLTNFANVEFVYLILSLVSKSFLTNMTLFGTIR
jgi:hypothetical protein